VTVNRGLFSAPANEADDQKTFKMVWGNGNGARVRGPRILAMRKAGALSRGTSNQKVRHKGIRKLSNKDKLERRG